MGSTLDICLIFIITPEKYFSFLISHFKQPSLKIHVHQEQSFFFLLYYENNEIWIYSLTTVK